jgi:tRNA G18 (ribose-2'-O)-methylase SpoU
LYIKQYGSVRSLNVGTASGIAMYALASNVF